MVMVNNKYFISFKDIENPYKEQLSKKRPLITRLCWLLLFIGMIAGAAYIVALLLIGYLQYSSYNLVYTTTALSYTLPAMTICNMNLLNKTKMSLEALEVDGVSTTYYAVYKELEDAYSDRSSTGYDSGFDLEDPADLFVNFAMDIEGALISDYTTFAKESGVDSSEFITYDYHESGRCMNLNDNAYLVQKVNGPIGGLTIVLDAQTEHYLPSTESTGFEITLRMANETVWNEEFSFAVSPGSQYLVNLQTLEVTRLESPWGTCANTDDLFNADDSDLTEKECYFNQLLWMYLKHDSDGCRCYPWYFWERIMENNAELRDRLQTYWTDTLPEAYQLSFNGTCTYDGSSYSGDTLQKNQGAADVDSCETTCRDTTNCRYFLFSDSDNDIQSSGDCWLYTDGTTASTPDDGVDTTGLVRGDTQCADVSACSIVAGISCENTIMDGLMEESTAPPPCYEPCYHESYSYELSSSKFPASGYWDEYMAEVVTQYDNCDDARANLVKLTFYTEQMRTTSVVQTASYELQNFIGEFGGVTDLFIGLSFVSVYQLIEWLVTRAVRKHLQEKDGKVQEAVPMGDVASE